MALAFLVLNAFILLVTLESDLGRRKIGWFRVLRPLVGAMIAVPFFFKGIALSGTGLWLEIAALVVGVATGFAACLPMRFEYDARSGRTFSRAGIGYAAAWLAIAAAKAAASYGAQSWFAIDLGRWMAENHVTVEAVRAAFIFLSLGAPVTRPIVLFVNGARTAHRARATLVLFRGPGRQRRAADAESRLRETESSRAAS